MSGPELAVELAMLVIGSTGLFEGLTWLASSPLLAALIMLGAMALLLIPTSKLCGSAIRGARLQRARDGAIADKEH
jgi:hypothetical protein